MLTGFFILSNKNLKQHPYTLIAMELLMHGGMYLSQDTNFRITELPYYFCLDYTMFWRSDISYREYYFYYVWTMNFAHRLYLVFLQAYLSFNVVLYSDLYLIMNNPFYPRERRVVGYYLFVLITSLGVYIFASSLKEEGLIVYRFFAVELVIYFIIISYTLIITICRLYKHGTSQDLRN